MITKYKTNYSRDEITTVEIVRETNKSVYVKDMWKGTHHQREAKISGHAAYHDSWEDAYAYILEYAKSTVNNARRSLEMANSKLEKIKSMKEY